jgi:hypothetical protein
MDVLQFILNFTLNDLETSILPRGLAFWPPAHQQQLSG